MRTWPDPPVVLGRPSLAGGIAAGCGTSRTLTGGGPGAGSRPARPSCYEIADDHCVAVVPATPTERDFSLALHVVVDGESDATIAWWELDDAMWTTEPGVA